MNRREARKQAFLLLFQYSFQPDDIQGLIDDFFAENKTGNQREYIDKVVGGVIESRFEIDEQLNKVSKDWHVERFSPVFLPHSDLRFLRCCIWMIFRPRFR